MNQVNHPPHLRWYVYVICEEGAENSGPCKVGTARNVRYRLAGLSNGNWRKLLVIRTLEVGSRDAAVAIERHIFRRFQPDRLPNRDWYICAPGKIAAYLSEVANEQG